MNYALNLLRAGGYIAGPVLMSVGFNMMEHHATLGVFLASFGGGWLATAICWDDS